jgi:xanthine dehydrogenase small subunit
MAMRRAIQFIFRGEIQQIAAFDPATTLLDWLREEKRATGTKEGCNEGDCGACTIVLARLDGARLRHDPVNACILLLGQIDGAELLTIEDLAADGRLHPVQAAMVRHHGSQCGFCTPGIVMSLFAGYQEATRPVRRETIGDMLAGNLCRCTGYRPIVDAAREVLAAAPDDPFTRTIDARRARLIAIHDDRDILVGRDDRFFASPGSLESLLELCSAHPEASIIAGATDAGLWVTKRLAPLAKVIALGRVAGLRAIAEDAHSVFLGAGVTLEAAMPVLAGIDPDLGTLMRRFGSRQVRASGTIGGNIANGSPIGDLAPALIALGARLHLAHRDGTRDMPIEDFFLAYGRQDRGAGEIVAGITVPRLAGARHFRAFKISKRFDEDISALMGAFAITLDGRMIATARIAYGGMAGTPKRALAAEAALVGTSIDHPGEWAAALSALDTDYQPISDMRASAKYRMKVARAILAKALIEIAGTRAGTRIIPREAEPAGASHG